MLEVLLAYFFDQPLYGVVGVVCAQKQLVNTLQYVVMCCTVAASMSD